jgi:hypothetical protein
MHHRRTLPRSALRSRVSLPLRERTIRRATGYPPVTWFPVARLLDSIRLGTVTVNRAGQFLVRWELVTPRLSPTQRPGRRPLSSFSQRPWRLMAAREGCVPP